MKIPILKTKQKPATYQLTKRSSRKEQRAADRTCSSEQSLALSQQHSDLTEKLPWKLTDRHKHTYADSALKLQRSESSSHHSLLQKPEGPDLLRAGRLLQTKTLLWCGIIELTGWCCYKSQILLPQKKVIYFT